MPMIPDLQSWRINHCLNLWLSEVDLLIRTQWTPQQDAKSNNAAPNDKQHNAALRRRNHEQTQKKKLDICVNHLFRSKEREKIQMGDYRWKGYLKSPIFDE